MWGTITVAADEHLEELNRMESLDIPCPKPTRWKIRFKSLVDTDYNRATALFLKLSNEELQTIL